MKRFLREMEERREGILSGLEPKELSSGMVDISANEEK